MKRAQEQKLRNGNWPGKAPIGYLNTEDEHENKTIEPDPQRAYLITKVFELYASGSYSMEMVRNEMKKRGLTNTTTGNKPISKSMVERTLKNPFYYGDMNYNGKLYQHHYEPLISRYLFNKAQEVHRKWNKKPFQYAALPFIFRGLLTCEICGCTITPEIKKGKYVYYSCTNGRHMHKRRVYVPEKDLLKPVYKVLGRLHIPGDKLEWLTSELKKIQTYENSFHTKEKNRLNREYEKIEDRIGKMYDDKLDRSITADMYDRKLKEYKARQNDILLQMEEHSEGDKSFYITANSVLDLASRALETFEHLETEKKRQLIGFVLQNPRLNGRKLVFTLKKPFDSIAECALSQNWLRRQDSNLRPSA